MSMQVGTNRSSVCSVEFDPEYLLDQQSKLWPEKVAGTLDPVANPADFFCPGTALGDRGFTPVPEYLLGQQRKHDIKVHEIFRFFAVPAAVFSGTAILGSYGVAAIASAAADGGAAVSRFTAISGGAIIMVGTGVGFGVVVNSLLVSHVLPMVLVAIGSAGLFFSAVASNTADGGAALSRFSAVSGGAIVGVGAGVGAAALATRFTYPVSSLVRIGLVAMSSASVSVAINAARTAFGAIRGGQLRIYPSRAVTDLSVKFAAAGAVVGIAAYFGCNAARIIVDDGGFSAATAVAVAVYAVGNGFLASSAAASLIDRMKNLCKQSLATGRRSNVGGEPDPASQGPKHRSKTREGGDRNGKGPAEADALTLSRSGGVLSGDGSTAGVIGVPPMNNEGQGRAPILAERVAAVVQGLTPAKIAEAEDLVRFNDFYTLLQDNGVAGRSEIIKGFWEILENKDYKRLLREDFLRTRQPRTVERVEAWLLNGGAVVQFAGRNRTRTFKGVCDLLTKYLQLSEEMRARVKRSV